MLVQTMIGNGFAAATSLLAQESDIPQDWAGSAVAVAGIAMITIIVAVAIWQGFTAWRGRMSAAREEAYRHLAEHSVELEKQLAMQQAGLVGDMATMKERLSRIEKLLAEVG